MSDARSDFDVVSAYHRLAVCETRRTRDGLRYQIVVKRMAGGFVKLSGQCKAPAAAWKSAADRIRKQQTR
jgi:hypothetical protein